MFDSVDSDEETGEPFCPVEVVNCGVHKDILDHSSIKLLNDRVANLQFDDLKTR